MFKSWNNEQRQRATSNKKFIHFSLSLSPALLVVYCTVLSDCPYHYHCHGMVVGCLDLCNLQDKIKTLFFSLELRFEILMN